MPYTYIFTNLKDSAISDDFEENFVKTLAKVLDKPSERITVCMQTGLRIYHKQNKEPACIIHIHAIDRFDEQRNAKCYTADIITFIKSQLNIENNRVSILFFPLQGYQLGSG